MRNDRGWTFIESMMTLTVLTVVSYFSLSFVQSLDKETTETLFIRQLQHELTVLQMKAKAEKRDVSLSFFRTYYEIDDGHTIIQKDYPISLQYMFTSNIQTISINPQGNVRKFGTIYFKSPSNMYRLRIQIGKGRLLYDE